MDEDQRIDWSKVPIFLSRNGREGEGAYEHLDERYRRYVARPGRKPVRWRFVMLLALDDILGVDPDVDDAIPDAATRLVRRATARQSRFALQSLRQGTSNQTGRGSSEDYDLLARNILAHPDWIASEHLPARKRQRLRARLVDPALARNSSGVAGFLLNRDLAGKLSSHMEGRGARFEGENEP